MESIQLYHVHGKPCRHEHNVKHVQRVFISFFYLWAGLAGWLEISAPGLTILMGRRIRRVSDSIGRYIPEQSAATVISDATLMMVKPATTWGLSAAAMRAAAVIRLMSVVVL